MDFDADNDGIPDNVEAQPTMGYLVPSATVDVNPITGIDVNYDPDAPIPGIAISPVDTDGDETPDFMDFDSDNDGTPDIEENGMADSIVTFMDSDSDGLDNLFEGSNLLDGSDVNDEIDNPSSSVLPDTDGDLPLGGDLDYRDAIDVYIESATVDFDGIDDHIAEDPFMAGWPDATLMAWVKLDPTFAANGDVAGQGMMRMYVDGSSRVLRSYYVTSAGSSAYGSSSITALDLDKWYHVAISYEGATGSAKIFINGKLERSTTIPTGTLSVNPGYADPDFNIGRNSRLDNSYFKGAIDEVRVFDVALTEDQVQRMVYQEVENQGGSVTGTLIDKRIVDIGSSTPVPWANLQAYYPMTNILTGKTIDASGNGRDATLKNIFTVQQQTAPMPYQTINDGAWSNANTWKHGTVWDITDIPNLKDWAIVKIASDVDVSQSIRTLGLTIDPGSRLTLNGENAITNNWYLELNGTLDLASDSQLVQGINSDLVTSAAGEILRRQEGNSDIYWYNYWSSPVGTPAATTLSDNNAPTNNTNNTPFSIDMLKDADGNAMTFTSGFDGSEGVLSDKWLYSYQNGLTYYDWTALTPTSAIVPGVGYTHKGTGFDSNPDMDITEQQYIFQGKPNNGTILLTADDVTDIYEAANGGESVQDTTLVTSLVGNPYPSALDARQFIADNAGVIEGTIRLWEQWDGASHWLSEYEGGYGFINNLTTERAYQYPGINLADPSGLTPGIKVPSFYIPVGQGFFVEVVTDLGDIEFNNGQRVFIKESDADGVNPENGSSFFREATADTDTTTDDTTTSRDHGEPFQILRLEFSVSSGASRSFVLGFSEDATDGFDYGYDGGLITNPPADDMGSILDGQQYVIQAFAPITPDKEVDLIMHSSGNYSHSIKATEISNFPEAQDLYLYDKLNDSYFDLRNGLKYDFTSVAGTFTDRFEVVFHDGTTLSNQDVVLEDVVLFVKDNALFVKGLEQQPKNLAITNMLGQVVRTFNGVSNSDIENGLQLGELSSGVYLVNLITENNVQLDKKIVIK
ncbi:MAG: T9SS type A sorting domain-containing protein [Bacteroidia bacterium]|nr:T9SS type A sorting domain-containing protein [Bacteroidia bacterium]